MLENLAGHELEQGEKNLDDRQETIVNQIVKPSTSSERNNQVLPHDLLQAIWDNIQRNEESRKKEREIDEKNRLAAEKRNEEKLDKLRANIIRSAELVTQQFRAEIDKQISLVDVRIEKVASTLTGNVTSLRQD
jgi:hypothetical protein